VTAHRALLLSPLRHRTQSIPKDLPRPAMRGELPVSNSTSTAYGQRLRSRRHNRTHRGRCKYLPAVEAQSSKTRTTVPRRMPTLTVCSRTMTTITMPRLRLLAKTASSGVASLCRVQAIANRPSTHALWLDEMWLSRFPGRTCSPTD